MASKAIETKESYWLKEIKVLEETGKEIESKNNAERRSLYARCQLLIMDLEEAQSLPSTIDKHDTIDKMFVLSDKSKLGFSKSKKRSWPVFFFDFLHEFTRGVATIGFMILSSTFVALPCVFFRALDQLLVRLRVISPFYQLAVLSKRLISSSFLIISGVECVTQGSDLDIFGKECGLVCFTHSSTLDAFVLTASVPVFSYNLSKAELFWIPFFSFYLLAFGGVPVNRSDRDQAVQAISNAASSAGVGDCVAVSPEGTRSKSGHILPFKKGPFYLWESLKSPIIPVVMYGAFDLYPPGNQIPNIGKVVCRFLPPIAANEAKSRAEMSNLLRRKMLEAWRDGPEDVGTLPSIAFWFKHVLSLVLFYGGIAAFVLRFPHQEWLQAVGLTAWQAIGLFFVIVIGMTIIVYLYLVYISFWLSKLRKMIFGRHKDNK